MTKGKKGTQEALTASEKPKLPLLAEVEDLNFEEAYSRLVGADDKGELYLGFANALEAATSATGTSQFEALVRILVGENVFIAGGPGTGKSSIVHLACRIFDMHGVEYEVAASTGAAAENIKGVTIHSLFGVDKNKHWDSEGRASYMFHKSERLRQIDTLIIDEVSMVYGQLWQEMDEYLRRIRKSDKAFGGIQIIAVGDFNQLKAVPDRDFEHQHYSGFPFTTPAWADAHFRYCFLTEAHRATDPELVRIIKHMSANALTSQDFESLAKRSITQEEADALDRENGADAEPTIRIYTRNMEVAQHNAKRIAELDGDSLMFESEAKLLTLEDTLTPTQLAQWKAVKSRAANEIELKIGTKVVADMPTMAYRGGSADDKNIKKNFWVGNESTKISNGSMGYVRAFSTIEGDGYYTSVDEIPEDIDVFPVVQFGSGLYLVPNVDSTIERPIQKDDGKWVSSPYVHSSMFPLKPGYAITVHKSQGQTYDGAVLDLSSSFTEGLGYVALSRVRRLDTAYILGSNPKSWQVDEESVSIMASITAWAAEDTKAFREQIADYDDAYKAFAFLGKKNNAVLSEVPDRILVATPNSKATSLALSTGSVTPAGSSSDTGLSGTPVSRDSLKRGWIVCQRLEPLHTSTAHDARSSVPAFEARMAHIKATGDADAMVALMVDMMEEYASLAGL